MLFVSWSNRDHHTNGTGIVPKFEPLTGIASPVQFPFGVAVTIQAFPCRIERKHQAQRPALRRDFANHFFKGIGGIGKRL